MPWNVLKIAAKARRLPEVVILVRILVGLVGVFVLLPVASSLRDPGDLVASDYVGLVLFTGVGLWLLRAAVRGDE